MQKKIICFLFISLFFFAIPVFAEENKFYFYKSQEEGEEGVIYYDTNLLDGEYFLNHSDMHPGKKYYDEMFIENGCDNVYSIFFKIEPLENGEFLKQIVTKIYLDDKLVYEGDGYGEENAVENSMFIGVFAPGEEKKLRVETMLDNKSNLINSVSFSSEWKFFAQLGDFSPPEPEIEPEPLPPPVEIIEATNNLNTFHDNNHLSIYLIGMAIAFIMVITIVIYKRINFEEEIYYYE